MHTFKPRTKKDAFYKQLAILRICIEAEQFEYVMPLLDGLKREMEKYCLIDWEPSIVFDVLKQEYLYLKHQVSITTQTHTTFLKEKMQDVSNQLYSINLLKAIPILRSTHL